MGHMTIARRPLARASNEEEDTRVSYDNSAQAFCTHPMHVSSGGLLRLLTFLVGFDTYKGGVYVESIY